MKNNIIALLLFISINLYAGIPLPGQDVSQSKGLNLGIGFGTLKQVNPHCKTLWTWTEQINYFYKDFLSGGGNIKFLGGNLDSANNVINQRYSINAKFINIQPTYAIFAGPTFSFENIDLNDLRIEHHEETANYTECREPFEKISSSIGYQTGIGFLLTPDWGLNFGHSLDFTFKKTYLAYFSSAIAFNLRNRFEKLIENTENFWLSLEYSFTPSKTSAHNIILGLVAGF
jgi:hypothetical protein